jgi:glycosyltransferase involved in cell wall biosynthesis
MTFHRRILLTQQSCAELYPPVLHQSALLGEIGQVTLLDAVTEKDDSRIQTSDAVTRVRVKRESATSRAAGLLSRLKWRSDFRSQFHHQVKATDVVIAYDPDAINLALSANLNLNGARRVAHLHEIAEDNPHAPLPARLRLKLMRSRLALADLVVVPDQHRGDLLARTSKLKTKPLVVMNCPRRLATLPNSLLMPLLRERGVATDKVVHYQGSVGPNHILETVIRSMRLWPKHAVFVIIGGGSENYLRGLKALAASEGVEPRVLFVGRIPYDQVFAYAVGASVGITMLDPDVPNWKFSAGASNKRFEYAALGIPQVTNYGPGIEELFGHNKIASMANHEDAVDVGTKISFYLNDPAGSKQVGTEARQLHLKRYNYEEQFQKVLEHLTTGAQS